MSKYLELVEGAFAQEHLDKQKNQNPYVAYSIKDGKVIYTIIPKEGYTVYSVISKDISNCTYNVVDLGLPSGLKWADRNVGATSPEEYGSYFQWGDTEGFTHGRHEMITATQLAALFNPLLEPELGFEITADNIHDVLTMMFDSDPGYDLSMLGSFSLDKVFDWESYFDTNDDGSTFIKYNNEGGLTVLEPEDDAATTHMGSDWRMPTVEDIHELINNTTRTFVDLQDNEYSEEEIQNGVVSILKGVRFTANNGNSIFIPAAGYFSVNSGVNLNYTVALLSSSLYGEYVNNSVYSTAAWGLCGDCNDVITCDSLNRRVGIPVRGVKP